ncbi:MAG: hypothetical protein IJA51_04390 [Oscillospiraceae bacterium]|nr:hypothetical protein [Oscillospiraceae bacterium]
MSKIYYKSGEMSTEEQTAQGNGDGKTKRLAVDFSGKKGEKRRKDHFEPGKRKFSPQEKCGFRNR